MRNALLIVACGFLIAGAALIYVPAGVILAGVLLGALVLLSE